MAGDTAWATIGLCVNGDPDEPVTGYIQIDCTGAPTGLNRYIRPDGTLYVGPKTLLTECCCVDVIGGSGGVKLASGSFGSVGSPWPDPAPNGVPRIAQAAVQSTFDTNWPGSTITEAKRVYKADANGFMYVDADTLLTKAALDAYPGDGRPIRTGTKIWVQDVNRHYLWDGLSWRIIGGQMPHLYYRNSVNQTITAGGGGVDLDFNGTLIEDTDSIKTGSDTTFTTPATLAGLWSIRVAILAAPATGTGSGLILSDEMNGFAANLGWVGADSGGDPQSFESIKRLSFGAGDTYKVIASAQVGNNYDVAYTFEAYLVEHRPDNAGWVYGPSFHP